MKRMERILIGDRTYPVKMDLNVLETLQEKFGSIRAFEMELVGLRVSEDGSLYVTEPSVRAVREALPAMVNEGLAIEAADEGRPWEPVDELRLMSECRIAYDELARMIHEELKRCFMRKKQRPEKKKGTICL